MYSMRYESLVLRFKNLSQIMQFLNAQTGKFYQFKAAGNDKDYEFYTKEGHSYWVAKLPDRFWIKSPRGVLETNSTQNMMQILNTYIGDERYCFNITIMPT